MNKKDIVGLVVNTGLCITVYLVTGCSATTPIGQVGDVTFYKVHSFDFDGPNFTALVTKDKDGKVNINYVFGSSGIGNSIIAAGGGVAANATMGMSLPNPGNTYNTVNGGATTVSTSANSNSRSGNNNSNTSTSNAANQNNNSNTANNTANNANKNDINFTIFVFGY